MTTEQPRDVADVYSEEGYYAVIPEWVLDADVSAQAVRLYAVLRRYADQRTMHANPSRKTLAARLKVKDEKVVDRAVADLERIGALSVIPRWRNEDGHIAYAPDAFHRERTSNGYQLHRAPKVIPSTEGGGGGFSTPTPSSPDLHPGGAKAPTVGAQKGEEPQPCEPQPSEPQTHSPSESVGAPANGDPQLALVPELPPVKKPKRRARIPEDWTPSPELLAKAAAKVPGVDVAAEARKFHAHHRAKGQPMLDWDLAFLGTWMGNVRPPRPGAGPYRNPQQPIPPTSPPDSDGWDRFTQGGRA